VGSNPVLLEAIKTRAVWCRISNLFGCADGGVAISHQNHPLAALFAHG